VVCGDAVVCGEAGLADVTGDAGATSGAPRPAPEPGRPLKLELTWDGTAFLGWQRQASGRTVQAELETALERVLGAPQRVVGAGRTDSGVHARRAVAGFTPTRPIEPARLRRALDALLPRDLGVRAVRPAPAGFHARRDARWKWYRYALLIAPTRRPLAERRAWRVHALPPIAALEAAAATLRGRHDFAAFANAGAPRVDTVRTLWVARWRRSGARATFDVVGDGFLYKMVRTLVGTQLAVARAADPAAAVEAILAARDRRRAGAPAPAHGLTLMDVGYGDRPPPATLGPRWSPPASPG
jgi:tRNA pseudouridine38-40 synthase